MILGCTAFAHRGLWSPAGPPENSIAAFKAAAAAGLGIELDVHLSRDNVPFVFHDADLERMTGRPGAVWHETAASLTALTLGESDERVPTLSQALGALPEGTPVLVEVKASPGAPEAYARAVDLAMFGTQARVAVMSFGRSINAGFRAVRPAYPRGVLIAPKAFGEAGGGQAVLEAAQTLAPDFLAPHVSQVEAVRSLVGEAQPLATWTVDTAEGLSAARASRAAAIFEHLAPALVAAG
ncbi:MAG: glycerophosphodiester phosphodiesterase family protein [Pseudomonadota bacterium]